MWLWCFMSIMIDWCDDFPLMIDWLSFFDSVSTNIYLYKAGIPNNKAKIITFSFSLPQYNSFKYKDVFCYCFIILFQLNFDFEWFERHFLLYLILLSIKLHNLLNITEIISLILDKNPFCYIRKAWLNLEKINHYLDFNLNINRNCFFDNSIWIDFNKYLFQLIEFILNNIN